MISLNKISFYILIFILITYSFQSPTDNLYLSQSSEIEGYAIIRCDNNWNEMIKTRIDLNGYNKEESKTKLELQIFKRYGKKSVLNFKRFSLVSTKIVYEFKEYQLSWVKNKETKPNKPKDEEIFKYIFNEISENENKFKNENDDTHNYYSFYYAGCIRLYLVFSNVDNSPENIKRFEDLVSKKNYQSLKLLEG